MSTFVKIIHCSVEECLKFVDIQVNLELDFESNLLNRAIIWTRTHLFFYALLNKKSVSSVEFWG